MSNWRPLYLTGMGMAVQYAVDLLANIPKKTTSDAVNNSDYWELVEKRLLKSTQTCPDQFEDIMDRLLEHYDRESVKMTMLKHEEIFKDQVEELHRLYKVQKMLMAELRNSTQKLHSLTNPSPKANQVGPKYKNVDNQSGFLSTGIGINSSNQTNSPYSFHQLFSLRADPSLHEESSSCSRDTFRMCRGFDLERPAEEVISTDFSAIEDQATPSSLSSLKDKMSINSSCDPRCPADAENDVELTLSIGFGPSNKNKPKNHMPYSILELGSSVSENNELRQMDPSMLIRSDQGEECSDPTKSTGIASTTFNRESIKQPPWLYQTLSLNRT